MKNFEIAKIFESIADILEIQQENIFRIRAYRKAAQNLSALTEDLEDLARKKELTKIPGIGQDLAQKIEEYLKTGYMKFYQNLKKEMPSQILDMITIPGVGPKTANLIYEKLKIKSISDLEKKAKEGKISGLPGIKDKTQENILRGIEFMKKSSERMNVGVAEPIAKRIIAQLQDATKIKTISPAGSLRRMKETIRDIDILATSTKPEEIMEKFTQLPETAEVLGKGATKSSILTRDGVQVDLRVVEPSSYGAALLYFTGSKAHNIKLRDMAKRKGLKINEYGVFKEKTETKVAGKTEEEIYKYLKMDYIPPELREDTGEIEAALKGQLPDLIELSDIKGDLQMHTKESDGANTIEQLVEAARKKGYEYIAITDHSKSLGVAGGLSEKKLLRHIQTIKRLNKKLKNFIVFAGAEVDILKDGSLDYPDNLLKELDFVMAAIHTGFKQSKQILTNRILTAMDNKYVNMLAHPTGRLMGEREGYEIDLEEIFKKAKKKNIFIEINAYPKRLDLNDINAKRAKQMGVGIAINTDAHNLEQLDNMFYGVETAKRGWFEKKDVLNTYSVDEVLKKIKRKD